MSYAVLSAPFAGVITEREADLGQVIFAGEAVMKLARVDAREAVVDIPGELIDTISIGSPFQVHLQIDPTVKAKGRVREIAPEADALTRTNRVHILLDYPQDAFRLGSLIPARPEGEMTAALAVPDTAILKTKEGTYVWVVENGTVHRRKVEIGSGLGGRSAVRSGLKAGERVVTAGVHSLEEGQKVALSEDGQTSDERLEGAPR
ncbi:efflux RND transporter periplasmic adaptor subunit [Breoghania sp.]|uniref:efflux RND transporter periplasmic adaptor subunit n=1 Tax=Breoghania sp. TaxID=2065378 RepID=UPI002619C9BC|nr:efflux RND transporter periplasmic adaptor subunit [Breoghania sp.]MDJ0931765.1 efflux RND transporter periplasmic adaptor subunit [Breoghania sp.]